MDLMASVRHRGVTVALGMLLILPCVVGVAWWVGKQQEEVLAQEPGCTCPGGWCPGDACTLQVEIEPGCGAAWGEAQVFVRSDTKPEGTVKEGSKFRLCQGFRAETPTQDGESFRYKVVSQDGRRQWPEQEKMEQCAASRLHRVVVGCR